MSTATEYTASISGKEPAAFYALFSLRPEVSIVKEEKNEESNSIETVDQLRSHKDHEVGIKVIMLKYIFSLTIHVCTPKATQSVA